MKVLENADEMIGKRVKSIFRDSYEDRVIIFEDDSMIVFRAELDYDDAELVIVSEKDMSDYEKKEYGNIV